MKDPKSILKIVSFDIFDTLLLRSYINPQEVWSVLEEEEGEKGFAKARKNADAVTYKLSTEQNRETTIEEAYELIPEYQHLKKKEMDLERKVLYANPEMLKLWNELGSQGKRRVIVSDMYLPADFIQSVLRENGYDGWDGFYLSRDYNARKTTSRLFQIMLEKESVAACEVLHIGDNEWSDVKMAQKLGINTYYYKKISERFFEICPFVRKTEKKLAGALALGWHKYKIGSSSELTYWNRIGFVIGGPLAHLYVSWIVKTAKQQGHNRILFVARDGYIWKKICDELYPEIETDYIYAPRIVSTALQGAVGSDPIAIKDRKKFISENLQNIDSQKIRNDYENYISSFRIDKNTAIVDGCSSGFSAQRLIEDVVGHEVFTYYLLSMSEMHNAAALYYTNGYSLQFQMLSEFLFGSPESPIKGVMPDGPVYAIDVSKEESFKMSVSEDICEGAVTCAKYLHEMGTETTPKAWLDYTNTFMKNLTDEDTKHLYEAKNAGDVAQKIFNDVTWTPYRALQLWIEKWGRATLYIYLILFNHKYRLYIGRGIKIKHWNMKYKVNVLVN